MPIGSLVARVALGFSIAITVCLLSVSVAAATRAQGKPNVTPEEQGLFKAILDAPDPAAKLKAGEALIKKYPKSIGRTRAARAISDQIAGVTDAAQKVTLAQGYAAAFKEPSEQLLIMPVLVQALAAANRFDEAFSSGSEFVTRNPDAIAVLVELISVGTDQARKKNPKFVSQSLQYGAHAIELIETDKKPADIDDASWKQYKTSVLPSLYQSTGVLNLVKGDRAEARLKLIRAAAISPNDPFNYLLLGGVLNEEYQNAAKQYQSMPAGAAKEEELKRVQTALDQVIDIYAHTIALAEGNDRLNSVRQQYLQDLESYYKYRHNGSTAGMQQLIDKYKVAGK